jgi:hypothetical protein
MNVHWKIKGGGAVRKGNKLFALLCLMTVLVGGMTRCAPARPPVILGSPIQSRASGYSTPWYAGSVYPSWLPTQDASEIYVSITVPSSAPRSDEFYYLLLSAWDSNGSYDQIGFSNFYGTWELAYSWTTGPPSNLTFHYPLNLNETRTLTEGATYTFSISFLTMNGVALFRAELGTPQSDATPFWSLNATTGGNYLILSNTYSGYLGYTNYEEVWYTHTSGGFPNFDFYFYNNSWVALNHTTNPTTWTVLDTTARPPSNVFVQINGSAVLVDNDYFDAPSPTIDQPRSLILTFNQHEGNITWHPSSQLPDHYTISVNGGSPTSYSWNGQAISYSVDGWPAGTYNVTCTVYDARGRSASSTVAVTVKTSTGLDTSTLLMIGGGVAVVVIVALAVVLQMRKKSN